MFVQRSILTEVKGFCHSINPMKCYSTTHKGGSKETMLLQQFTEWLNVLRRIVSDEYFPTLIATLLFVMYVLLNVCFS